MFEAIERSPIFVDWERSQTLVIFEKSLQRCRVLIFKLIKIISRDQHCCGKSKYQKDDCSK